MKRFFASALLVIGAVPVLASEVTVQAGKVDRRDTVVTFAVPDRSRAVQLREGQTVLPVQVLPDGRGAFLLPELKAGQSRTFKLEAAGAAPANGVEAMRDGTNVALLVGGRAALQYNGEKTPLPAGFEPQYARGGYIYPIVTPSGTLVADDYPPQHKHHHGLWTPWTKTEFQGRHPDFWNMGDKTGTVEFVQLVSTFGGPVVAGLEAKHRFVDLSARPAPKVALNETWNVALYPGGKGERAYNLFDLTSTQTCATDQPLILPKYHYGGMGLRGHRTWDGKPNCEFLTSEGKTRADGNETRARWCYLYGKVDGKTAGVAVLSHPGNFRAPQPIRIHPTEPYFSFAPQQMGEFRIEPGKAYVSRYRVVAMDGGPDKALLERLWEDYASPPEVSVK
jgi:hypothetical protein